MPQTSGVPRRGGEGPLCVIWPGNDRCRSLLLLRAVALLRSCLVPSGSDVKATPPFIITVLCRIHRARQSYQPRARASASRSASAWSSNVDIGASEARPTLSGASLGAAREPASSSGRGLDSCGKPVKYRDVGEKGLCTVPPGEAAPLSFCQRAMALLRSCLVPFGSDGEDHPIFIITVPGRPQ